MGAAQPEPRKLPYVERDPKKLRPGMVVQHKDYGINAYRITGRIAGSDDGWAVVSVARGKASWLPDFVFRQGFYQVIALPETKEPEAPKEPAQPQVPYVERDPNKILPGMWVKHAREDVKARVLSCGAPNKDILVELPDGQHTFMPAEQVVLGHVTVLALPGSQLATCNAAMTLIDRKRPEPEQQHNFSPYAGCCVHCMQPIGQKTPSKCPGGSLL